MSHFKGKWVAHHKGDIGEVFEVAVVREDNTHGFKSYGWFAEGEKLYISGSGGPCRYTVNAFVWEKLLNTADAYAAFLNQVEAGNAQA